MRRRAVGRRLWAKFGASVALSALVLGAFSVPVGSFPPLGSLLDPTAGIWNVATGSRHPARAEAFVSGLSAPVSVLRDTAGVPHIYAASGIDAWFALGYVHAQDRLFQMDIQARAGAGRLSEVLGPEFLDTDKFFRTIGLHRMARAAVDDLGSAEDIDIRALRAYAAGVNGYLSSIQRADLPLEFKLIGYEPEPWSPEKSVTLGGLIAFGLAWDTNDIEFGLLVEKLGRAASEDLFPRDPASAQVPIEPGSGVRAAPEGVRVSEAAAQDILRTAAAARKVLPSRDGIGSNNWAVSGNRTSSGKPLLAADPHLALSLPSVWYWAEIHGDPYHIRGATFPGVPGVFFGTNGRIAWGETNTGADVTDYYLETFSDDGNRFLFRGEWQPVTVHDEPIRIRGGATEPFRVRETIHGPVITERDQVFAMRTTLTEFRGELKAILLINRATSWPEFREALRTWRVPAQNFVYADDAGTNGTIAIRSNGLFPIRNGTVLPREPLDGASGVHEWIGEVPFDDYPEAVNPYQGFVLSANQVPVGSEYPYYLGTFWAEGYRARRIHALLAADAQVTPDDLRRFQLDVGDSAAEALVPILLNVAQIRGRTPDLDALAALATWNFSATTDSVAATLWWTFLLEYREATFGDEYAAAGADGLPLPYVERLENLTLSDPSSAWFDDVSTPTIRETRNLVIQSAFEAAIDRLVEEMGLNLDGWTWGLRHARQFDHLTGLEPLARGPVASPGNGFTINVAAGLVSRHGPSWRQLMDFSDLNASRAVYPGGQSGNPLSPHYGDLLDLYLRGEYLPFRGRWSPEAFAAADVESTLLLRPG